MSKLVHGRIDKETQSPLLNIFKEIMTREKDDPEKRNLLNEPREEKKKRQYSGSKTKADRRSCESSSSEHRKRGSPCKIPSTEQRGELHNKARSPSIPYQSEKKDSWWFWQNTTPPKKTEDLQSCSCVSCALKRIVSSEYACVGCLLLLFAISIIVAFLVVFKNVPNIGGDCKVLECKDCQESSSGIGSTTPKCAECRGIADSERLKRKIEMLSNKRLKKGFYGVNEFRKEDDKGYDDVLSGQIGVPGVAGIDFGPSFRELNSVEESERKQSNAMDLANVLDSDSMEDIQNSEKLRDFYKKLLQTDAKIKSLKKITQDESRFVGDDVQKSPERSRRSLKLYHYPKRYRVLRRRRSVYGKQQKINETSDTKAKFGNKTRLKRGYNEPEEPTGFIIEKKKVLVQYKPAGKRRIPVKKCQHAPAVTQQQTHEKQMMHPFYKNTQRLDLLLDKFLNKNIPEIMSDPFGIDEFFKHDKPIKPCKHPKPKPHKNVNIIGDESPLVDQIPKPKFKFKKCKDDKFGSTKDLFKVLRPESSTQFEKKFFNHEAKMIAKQKKKIVTASPSDFEVLLSVSTVMNPEVQKISKRTTSAEIEETKAPTIDKVPNLRRLMQLEAGEDEDNLGYEDFKEVMSDDMDNHDELEKFVDRKRTNNNLAVPLPKYAKFNPPPSIHNPNWKGAMPLYPDEINSMFANKMDLPKPTYDLPKPTYDLPDLLKVQRKGRDLSDVEYVEDYLSNKYNRLVQQAQAYSDYGVLDGKKESRNEKDSPSADGPTNHKIKLLADENFNNNKAGLLGRKKRGRVPRATTNKPEMRRQGPFISEIEVTSPAQTGINSNYLKLGNAPTQHKSEGIRFEMAPTTKAREDLANNFETIMKIVSKHVKLKPKSYYDENTGFYQNFIHSTIITPSPKSLTDTTKSELAIDTTTVAKSLDELEKERELLLAMTRGNRRLLSTGPESSSNFRDYKDSFGFRRSNPEINRNSIDRFVQKLHMNKNPANERAIKNYIEGVTQMNIKVYSTPDPSFSSIGYISESSDTFSEKSMPITDPIEISKDLMEAPKLSAGLPESEVTINKSLVKIDTGDSFFGKILLTVKDPVFGAQNFNLMFDVPLIMNFKEELMMMSDNMNYPNIYNQFGMYNDTKANPQVSNWNSYPKRGPGETIKKKTNRLKRETNITATWLDSTETREYTKKNLNVQTPEIATEVTVIPNVISRRINTSVTAFPAVSLAGFNTNRSDSSNSTSKTGRCANDTAAIGDNMTLSEFFTVVANWFRSLEYGKQDKPTTENRNSSGSGLTDLLLTINGNINNKSQVRSTDSAYPMYDSDMIENIGHRSRVLLSVEDNVTNVTEGNQIVNSTNVTEVTAAPTAAEGNVFNRTTSTTLLIRLRSNVTTTKKSPDKDTLPTLKKDNKTRHKTIVKRNADNSNNLIFWNDIYDDEYGIQTDKMDNYMKGKVDDGVTEKHSVKEKDFIKRSGRWVQNKIRRFAKNLKIKPHSNDVPNIHSDSKETKERVPRSLDNYKKNGLGAISQTYYRDDDHVGRKEKDERDEIEEDYPDVDQKSLFAALSVNMKEVCKKAAKAVQQTRNMDNWHENVKTSGGARDEARQGTIANALMQQLVRLLTDLVDYQVQQKTCTKLPSELQSFLEWLTYSKEETDESDKQSDLLFKNPSHEHEELIDEFQDKHDAIKMEYPDEVRLTSNPEYAVDERTRYQDNIQAVQELLEQYDGFNDVDKGKMLGVRGYLEKQLAFLNQQLSAYDLYTFFEKSDINRKKRDIFIMQQRSTTHRPRRRRRPHKFLKNFGKKHTRTTAGYHDEAQVTDIAINRKIVENEKIKLHSDSDKMVHQKLTKRNLKDVYYKAVADAKKFSSAKIIVNNKDESSLLLTSTVMGHALL